MKPNEFARIGSDLVADSKARERTPGEVLQELYPYVLEASRRMSAREISKWLEEKHGIQISQPTISRALRNPEAFGDWFTENIEPTARRISSSLSIPIVDLLFDDTNEGAYKYAIAQENAKEALGEAEFKDVEEGMKYLHDKWFSLSIGTRRACYPAPLLEETEEGGHVEYGR